MARYTTKSFQTALRYMFANRYGLGLDVAQNIDHDYDNNKSLAWSNAADTASIHAFKVDGDNLVQSARAVRKGERVPVSFYMTANAGLATQPFYVADRVMTITDIEYSHSTAGTDAGAVSVSITKDTGTQAPGAGTAVQSAVFDGKGTVNVVQYATLAAVDGAGNENTAVVLAAGDRLSVLFAGTLTALAGVVVTVWLTPGQKIVPAVYQMSANGSIATQNFFLANRDFQIVGAYVDWGTAATDSGTVTVDIFKDTSTNNPGGGTSILAAAQSVKGTANTPVSPALSATAATLKLAAGNRLSVKFTGTLTALANIVVVVYLQSYNAGYVGQVEANFNINANGSQATTQFFIADRDYEVVDVSEVHDVAGTDGGTVSLDVFIDKLTNTPGGGATALSAVINAKATADTVQVSGLSTSRRARLLSQGDRLTAKYTGTLTALVGANINVSLLPR